MAEITTILGTDTPSDSRVDINQNFVNLNTDKIEADQSVEITNKTINADSNTISELETDNFKTGVLSGNSTTVITGTQGPNGRLAQWTTEGNIEDSGIETSNVTLNNDTDVSGNTWVLDEDDLVSDSDTKVPTQQSVKTYVDNQVASGGVPDSLFAWIATSGSEFTSGTDDLEVKFGATSQDMYVQTPTEFRAFDATIDFGITANISSIWVYNGDVYVLMSTSLFRINDVKTDLAGATITNLTTTGITLGTDLVIDVSGNFHFRNGLSVQSATISGDTLTSMGTVTLVSSIVTVPVSFGVTTSGDFVITDTAERYERLNSSGVSQISHQLYFPANKNHLFGYVTGGEMNMYALSANEASILPSPKVIIV